MSTTSASHRHTVGLLAVLFAVIVGLAGLLAPHASARPLHQPETPVAVNPAPAAQRVEFHERIPPGQRRARAPGYDQTAVGSCVAAENGGGGEAAVTEGAATAGEDIVGTSHDALRPTQDWINPAKVDEYIAQLRAGEDVPPIETQRLPNGDEYILEGHHRYVASMQTGIPIDRIATEGPGPVGMPDWSKVFYEPWLEEP